jgi:hypothetical protein
MAAASSRTASGARDDRARRRAHDGHDERLRRGASKLAAALAAQGALPRRLAGDASRSVPRRPLLVVAALSGWYLLLPAVSAICFVLIRRRSGDVRPARSLPIRSLARRR